MVLCVETPYYLWGVGGFAPEDQLVVTKDGYELMTTPQRELIVI
jgi:Xaa-Pro aminopeptidase